MSNECKLKVVGAERVVCPDGCRESTEHVGRDADVAHGDAARDLGDLVLRAHHRPDAVHRVAQKQCLAVRVAGQGGVQHTAQVCKALARN